jgi:hypothetical protein
VIDTQRTVTDLGSVHPTYRCGQRGTHVTLAHGERWATTQLMVDQAHHIDACIRCRALCDDQTAAYLAALSQLFRGLEA